MKEILEKEIERIKALREKIYNNPNYTTYSGELTTSGKAYANYYDGKLAGLKLAMKLLERND